MLCEGGLEGSGPPCRWDNTLPEGPRETPAPSVGWGRQAGVGPGFLCGCNRGDLLGTGQAESGLLQGCVGGHRIRDLMFWGALFRGERY